MTNQNLLTLQEAIEREKTGTADQHKRFINLLSEMYAFEHGKGCAPSVDDFLLWRAAAEKHNAG